MKKIRIQRKSRHNPHCQPGMHGMFGGYGYYGAPKTVDELEKEKLPKLYTVGMTVEPVHLQLLAGLLTQAAVQSNFDPGLTGSAKIAVYLANPGTKYTQELSTFVKDYQKAVGLGDDGKVGRKTWSKLKAAESGWKLPDADVSSSSPSTGNGQPSTNGGSQDESGFELSSIPQQVWFYPTLGVTLIAIVVALLRSKKKKKSKKKSTPQMIMNRF